MSVAAARNYMYGLPGYTISKAPVIRTNNCSRSKKDVLKPKKFRIFIKKVEHHLCANGLGAGSLISKPLVQAGGIAGR